MAGQGVSNLGDGVYLTALPLLAATLTRDPLPVSAVTFAEWLPWLLFGLLAGALLDRWERRRVMWTVDAARLLVVGGFALGRVISAFRLFSYGAVPLGALLGGVLARRFGLPAPFLVAGVAIPVMALLVLPLVNRRAVEQALDAVENGTA